MITITPDNQIDRDGEVIGSIIGGIAWLKSKQAPRIVGQIRQAAGIDGLKFEIADTPEDQVKLMVQSLPTDTGAAEVAARAQEILSPPISSAAGVDDGSVMEPVPVSEDAEAGISFAIGSDWGTPGTPYFARCFINHHGPDAYSKYCKANGI